MLLSLRQRLVSLLHSDLLTPQARLSLQSALLFLLVSLSSFIALGAAWLCLRVGFGMSDPTAFLSSISSQVGNIPALLVVQALVSSIGTFLLPTLLFHWLFFRPFFTTTGLQKGTTLPALLVALLLIFSTGIFIQLLVALNTAVVLPASLAFLREGQGTADTIINALFNKHSVTRFVALTIVVAVMPAICEEVFFRGTLQRLLIESQLGVAGSILLSGLAFSVMHLEFNNFLAIWWMGIILGCIYFLTNSLWASIAAHFLNNFLMVAGKMAYESGLVKADIAGEGQVPFIGLLAAGIVMCILLWWLHKIRRNPFTSNS